ncbi:hypothetical protein LWI28_006419 [Acer negundo]|uniref:Uncharacterized protein n=1 Tax=Acer negundo TaxID=4023 RepID=A0AAD5ICG1_ACENE|nr:hypothetical protein LWI28_006419 [Acer negundo]
MEIDPNVDSMEGSSDSGSETLENSSSIGKEKVSKKGIRVGGKKGKQIRISGGGAKETDDVFSIRVGGKASDDLELGRLKATDKDDSLWGMKQQEEDRGMKQQEEDIDKRKSEVDLYLLERAEKLNERFDVLAWWKNFLVKFPIINGCKRYLYNADFNNGF